MSLIYLGLDATSPDIATNLAIDEALLDHCEAEGRTRALRFWESPTYAVVLGASCRVHDDVDVEYCQTHEIALARRSSGGGTVLIGPSALNIAIVSPIDEAPGLNAVDVAQRHVMQRIADALTPLSPTIAVQGPGDLTLEGRKCSGSAQRRLRNHFMVHASILCDFDIPLIERCLRMPNRQPTYRNNRSHESFLANLSHKPETLVTTLKYAWGITEQVPTTGMDVADIRSRVEAKFGNLEWTMRF